jgi:hypothetical protein
MARGAWLLGGAAVGLGVIALATRKARASTVARGGELRTDARRELVPAVVDKDGAAVEPRPPAGAPRPPAPAPAAASRLSPLLNPRVSPNGAFRAIRTKGHGNCRRGNYPCTHWGVDLVPASHYRGPIVEAEWWCRAPEDLIVDLVVRDDETPPLSGYGPGAVLARGRSGTWHVFGHLSPRSFGPELVKGAAIARGQFFARLATGVRPPHVHWEPRRWRTEGPAAKALGRAVTREDIVIDPDLWLREAA